MYVSADNNFTNTWVYVDISCAGSDWPYQV